MMVVIMVPVDLVFDKLLSFFLPVLDKILPIFLAFVHPFLPFFAILGHLLLGLLAFALGGAVPFGSMGSFHLSTGLSIGSDGAGGTSGSISSGSRPGLHSLA
jgi:hypothetical protein